MIDKKSSLRPLASTKNECDADPYRNVEESNKRKKDIWWFSLYIVAWQPAFHFTPVELVALIQPFAAAIATVVPSINAYAVNSPDPARVAVFMAINWCLYPLYIVLAYRRYGRWPIPHSLKLSWSKGILVTLSALILVPVPLLLPTEISVDPLAIRPSRVWEKWMHEMLWPNGVSAVLLPLVGTGFLLAASIAFRLIPFKSSIRRP